MEKKISMNDIIAFVEKAMKENLNIQTIIRDWDNIKSYTIRVYGSNEGVFIIECLDSSIDKEKNYVQISKGVLDWVDIEASEMDIALFKVEVLKAQEYSRNKVIEAFNNFFKDEESKLKDINDLDDKED